MTCNQKSAIKNQVPNRGSRSLKTCRHIALDVQTSYTVDPIANQGHRGVATEACFHTLFTHQGSTGDELSSVENFKTKL